MSSTDTPYDDEDDLDPNDESQYDELPDTNTEMWSEESDDSNETESDSPWHDENHPYGDDEDTTSGFEYDPF